MSKTIVDNRQINYNFFPSYIRCFHYTFSSQAQDQLPTQAKMIAILNNVFIKKKYNIIAQVKDYKVDAMIFCPGCSCKFNLRFIPYFLFLSSSCLFCSFQFAVRFSPPLLLVSCSRITKKHTCTNDELFILNLYVKEHDSKLQISVSWNVYQSSGDFTIRIHGRKWPSGGRDIFLLFCYDQVFCRDS